MYESQIKQINRLLIENSQFKNNFYGISDTVYVNKNSEFSYDSVRMKIINDLDTCLIIIGENISDNRYANIPEHMKNYDQYLLVIDGQLSLNQRVYNSGEVIFIANKTSHYITVSPLSRFIVFCVPKPEIVYA